MPIMTRMRDSMPVILVGLVIAFLLTIVFEWGMDYLGWRTRGSNYVGKINGHSVTYQEFNELVRRAAENQKAQTKNELDEAALAQVREQVWNQVVTQTLLDEEIKRLGIMVTDDEIVDWVRGPNPPDFLRRQFTDSLGKFNREAYDNAIQDPRNKDVWVTVEKSLRQQRLQEKLQSIILAGVRATENESYQRFLDQNLKLDAQYVLFDPGRLVKDDEIEMNDEDLRKYYNAHSEDYKVEATRKLRYILFKEEPSAQDTQAVLDDMQDILKRVKDGGDFATIAGQYGEVKKSDAFIKRTDISQVKEEAIFRAKPGDILGPLKDSDGFHLIKVEEMRDGKDELLRASHILVSSPDNDSVKALKEAREVMAALKRGESFTTLAEKHSKDKGSMVKGGDLGWFGKGRMVKEFEAAAFTAKIGKVVGPVRTQFGYHIIKVTDRSKKEAHITDFAAAVKVTAQTRNSILQKAQDFAYLAQQNGFEKEAEAEGLPVSETNPFAKNAAIPGIGVNSVVTNFAFEGKVGNISEVLTVQPGNAVFIISDVRTAGVQPFDEVKTSIQARTLREKKMAKVKVLADEISEKVKSGAELQNAIQTHSELALVSTGQFSPTFVPTVGRDMAFIGVSTAMKPGEISKPIEGVRGYYIIKLLTRSAIDTSAFHTQQAGLMTSITQEKRNRFVTDWLDNLKKGADIEDHRDQFYR